MAKYCLEGKTHNLKKIFVTSLVANMALQFRILLKTRTGEASCDRASQPKLCIKYPWRGFRRADAGRTAPESLK